MVPFTFKYVTPFAFLALVPLGGWLGGRWTLLATAAIVICITTLGPMLEQTELRKPRSSHALKRRDPLTMCLPRIYIVAQLSVTLWVVLLILQQGTSLLEAIGLAISVGVTTGVFGFVAAHEMVHSSDNRDRDLGLVMLATTFYMHFHIAHLKGHHRRAATHDDATSARLGEGLYGFLLRAVAGQVHEAWIFEVERLRLNGERIFGSGNRMLVYCTIEATLLIVLALVSWRAVAFMVATAVIAVSLLETFNYVAHYGLQRRAGTDGRIERLTPHHSWNSKRHIDNAALFNMGCHSDHHCHPSRPFEQLQPIPGAAELPFCYGTALLTALIPPLWRQIMDKRAIAAMTVSQTPRSTS